MQGRWLWRALRRGAGGGAVPADPPAGSEPRPQPWSRTESAALAVGSVLLPWTLCLTFHALLHFVLLPCGEVSTSGGLRKQPELVYSLPTAAVTNDHPPGGLNPFLQHWRSEACTGSPRLTPRGGCAVFPPEAVGRIPFLVFSSSRRQPACLGSWPLAVFKVASSHHSALNSVSFIMSVSLTLTLLLSPDPLVITLASHR